MPEPIPLSAADLALWRGNITKARQARKTVSAWWDANLKAYAPAPTDDPERYSHDINTNRDFTLVERKKADLFYQRPDVTAIPSPLFDGQEGLLDAHTTILNEKLGLNGVNAKRLVHQVLFDVLCTAGTGWTAMGYESATVPVVPNAPVPVPGQILGLSQPPPAPVPVPLYEDCFWRWFSPKSALCPHDARTTIVDDWPWVGMEFEIPIRAAKRKGWVPQDYAGGPSDSEMYFDHGISQGGADAIGHGVLIYYKSALYRDDRVHPLHQTQLILMEGIDTPAEHKDSPYQDLDAQGALTPDSLIGYPIHPLTIRVLTDSAVVPSDCTISRPLVNELNKFREQMVEQREANVLRWSYNTDVLPPDALSKIIKSPLGGFIGMPGEAFVGEGAVKELPHGTYPRENFQFNDYLDGDLSRTHAINAEQSGAADTASQTATEAGIKQSNVNARLGLERGVVLDWYCTGVTKFSQLLMRYLTIAQATAIVGPQPAQAWDGWRKTIPAALAFTALPDSTIRNDLATERDRAVKEYSFLANDPFVNRQVLLKKLATKLHYPQAIVNEQPPAKAPEPAKPSFAFTGADLNPLAPQFAIVMDVLKAAGFQISPQAVQEAQAGAENALLAQPQPGHATGNGGPPPNTQHGGMLPPAESLSKHHASLTGGMPGTGAPAEIPAGNGQVQ